MNEIRCDAVILGGGLAGLTLALQLRNAYADLDIVVLERQQHPLPAAAHKVGESTVEIGAHYFDTVLGLSKHLDSEHLRKFGLRYFFSDGCDDIAAVTELGGSHELPVQSYQIDRGIFETFLGEEARRRGIDFRDGRTVKSMDVGEHDAPHKVRFTDSDGDHALTARWLLDASGRAGLLRRRFDLTVDNGHHANAVWFRLDQRIQIDGFSDDPVWGARCTPPERWRSTNHLMGPGYWAWLIPLASGAHSIGIVADAGMHPLDDMRDFDRAMDWLHVRQPALAQAIEPHRDALLDFRFMRNYSYSCKQLFSADRWALTGEAATFLDPFYSPGSDFIAINNTYITALIGHDRAGQSLAPFARFYQDLYFSFYDNTLSIFRDQYPLFGDAEVLPAKVAWDYAYYWGVLCQLVFQQRLTDLNVLGALHGDLERAQSLNLRIQQLFRQWHAASAGRNGPAFIDQTDLDWFVELNCTLHDTLDSDGVIARVRRYIDQLEGLADVIMLRAAACDPGLRAPLSGRVLPPLFPAAA